MATRKKKNKRTERAPEQTRREVFGVFLIALGIFFGASMYSDAVGLVGRAVCSFTFGVFGACGYALPVIVAALGVLTIIFSEQPWGSATSVFTVLFVVSLLGIIHVAARGAADSIKLIDYYKDAYTYGETYRAGGGLAGALLAYPALILMGSVGTYIAFIAVMLISFLLVTRISIKRAGERLGSGIKRGVTAVNEHISDRKAALYTEELAPQGKTGKPARTKQRKPAVPTFEPGYDRINSEREPLSPHENRVKDTPGELEFMPTTGVLEKRRDEARQEKFEHEFESMQEEATEGARDISEPIARIARNAPETPAPATAANTGATVKEPLNAAEIVVPATPDDSVPPIYQRPPFTLLNEPEQAYTSAESPKEKAKLLEETLANFNISAKVVNYTVGPAITRFEVQPAQGVRVNRITSLSQDIALALAASRVRIEAPIPGKAAIGIEVPNRSTASVLLREIVESPEFQSQKSPIAFALGKDIAGKIIVADLDRMPHMLIAGATGSGKSVCMNDIIISMAYKASPDDVRMVLIDPKVVEMRMYASLPHLLLPVVTDAKKAAGALKWTVVEMERRYQLMAGVNARDLARYNSLMEDPNEKLPRVVVVIDELADLMMVSAKDVEDSICRIAQLGRASGIHLLVATQRPSTDVITGLIKANIPSRIAFAVSSAVDSRVILDEGGAEKLLGKGDMLFHANGAGKPIRVQGAFVSDEEVERVMNFFAEHQFAEPMPEEEFDRITSTVAAEAAQGNGKQEDELLGEAVKIVLDSGQASISMIQRRLRVGYARAARLIDIMEQKKIVSGYDGSKPRRLLIDRIDYERMFGAAAAGQDDEDET